MNIFESGMPTVLEIASISAGTDARALMGAGTSSMSAASTTPTPSVTASTFRIYVISNSGNDDENAISTGIYMGTWHDDIVPFINQSYLEHQMNLDIDALKARTKVVSNLEHAVARCVRDDIMPIYQGPQDQWGGPLGFGIGENVERYLNNAMVKDDSEPDEASSDGEPDEESSDGESKCGDCEEPEADENHVPAQRHATTDANDLFDNAPPTQPPSRATKFNADLGNVAAAAVAPMTPGSPGYQLEVLTQRIESVDVNTNIEVLRGIIRDNGLSVSPATGGSEARTKFTMINEMRNIVGSVPLPVEALLNRHSRPTPVPAAPMGFRVDHVHPVESFASEHARRWEAVERNSEQGRYAPRLETPNSVYLPRGALG